MTSNIVCSVAVCCCLFAASVVAGEKERETDGAFSPHDHFPGGHHNPMFDYEAILGSKGIAEKFGHLKPAVAKQRLQVIVEKMDKSRDGFVDKKELTAWVLRSFHMMSEQEADERFEQSDRNKDTQVAWSEYAIDTYGVHGEHEQEYPQDQKMMRDDKVLFHVSDLNGDGFLDKKEFQAFSHPEDFDYTATVLYERTLIEKDINRDGKITFNEFILPDGKDRDQEWMITEKDRFDQDFDKNGDGYMDKEETILWLQPNNWDTATIEAEHLIEKSDDNKDGKLSVKEILDHHSVFVGSEVTDFGNHLQAPHKYYDEL